MIPYDLTKIRAIIFDVDGVLSRQTITLHADGTPLRTANIKDGYAIQLSVKLGLRIAIMTGARVESIRTRYESLGMSDDIYTGCSIKIKTYEAFCSKHGLRDDEVMYMGDDVPDLEVMRRVGCPVCPRDACPEVQEASIYISHLCGGEGCARDVIEQTLRAKDLWLMNEAAFGW